MLNVKAKDLKKMTEFLRYSPKKADMAALHVTRLYKSTFEKKLKHRQSTCYC